jgi:hypothetical protein
MRLRTYHEMTVVHALNRWRTYIMHTLTVHAPESPDMCHHTYSLVPTCTVHALIWPSPHISTYTTVAVHALNRAMRTPVANRTVHALTCTGAHINSCLPTVHASTRMGAETYSVAPISPRPHMGACLRMGASSYGRRAIGGTREGGPTSRSGPSFEWRGSCTSGGGPSSR